MRALFYYDEGISEWSRKYLPQAMQDSLGGKGMEVATILADQIIAGDLDSAQLLIMPGGADRPYIKKLGAEGCRQIRRFVSSGGTYLGICAGAYFAASKIEWNTGAPGSICAERDLKFFSGKAIGPLTGPGSYQADSEMGARVLRLHSPDGASFASYYNGGCWFEPNGESYEPIAFFTDYKNRLAVVKGAVGKGRVVLSGVHPEFSPAMLGPQHACYPELKARDAQRAALWVRICDALQ